MYRYARLLVGWTNGLFVWEWVWRVIDNDCMECDTLFIVLFAWFLFATIWELVSRFRVAQALKPAIASGQCCTNKLSVDLARTVLVLGDVDVTLVGNCTASLTGLKKK